MARRKKTRGGGGGEGSWLVTFSDLMTLLLTFFVLLLTMTTMDTTVLTRISAYVSNPDYTDVEAAGKISERIREIIELLRDPDNVFAKQERLKDLLFPDEVLPPDLLRGDLEENLRILTHPEGVVIVLTEGLLFPHGSAALDGRGMKLLEGLAPVILGLTSDVNISGHTDPTPSLGMGNDDLSVFRALAVLDRFLAARIPPDRFSVSGYGADKPMYPNTTADGRAKNNRVEILVKTTQRLGRYI